MTRFRKGADTGSGLGISWEAVHRSGAGKLISAQRKRGRWFLYFFGNWDDNRVKYCEKHRNNHLPANFREGDFSLSTLLFTLKLKIRGEWSGL